MAYNSDTRESIPAFHVLTGCDTTSYIAGHSKKSAWMTFQTRHRLLENLGKGEETIQNTEQFICKLYKLTSVRNTNEARLILFNKTRSPESLPPTSDALYFHIQRAHYQATIWRQAHLAYPTIPNPESMGWKKEH